MAYPSHSPSSAPRAVPGTIGRPAQLPGTLSASPIAARDRAGTVATGFNVPGTFTTRYGLRSSGTVC